jgi:hypothetical protein
VCYIRKVLAILIKYLIKSISMSIILRAKLIDNERYVMHVVEIEKQLYVTTVGLERLDARPNCFDFHCFCPEKWQENADDRGILKCQDNASLIIYYKDIEKWKQDCTVLNYDCDSNGLPLPRNNWEWDTETSIIPPDKILMVKST